MKTLKRGCKGSDVVMLCQELNRNNVYIEVDDVFGPMIHNAVCEFQQIHNLVVDGIVGYSTWEALLFGNREHCMYLTDDDFERMSLLLDCEVATIKAVQEVESAGCGFIENNMPTILFEGHIFWNQLKKHGINPEHYVYGNEDILYRKWTKSYYEGGIAEYDRLERAMSIDKDSALESASWGMFQIMGFNYDVCSEKCVSDFVDKMYEGEYWHLIMFGRFLKKNNMIKYLQNKDWAGFAYRYNGSGYRENRYDEKLARAHNKWS